MTTAHKSANAGANAAPATAQPAAPAGGPAPVGDANAEVVRTSDVVTAKRGSYVVAPGRTVIGDDGKSYDGGRGETEVKVTLAADEAERLLKAGFLRGKDGALVIQADGPAVNVEDGVQVKTA